MSVAMIDESVERTIDIALGAAEPKDDDVEHRKFRRRAARARIAVLPTDEHGRQGVRLVVRTNEVSSSGFSATARRPLPVGATCAVLLPASSDGPVLVGAYVTRCHPGALGGWRLGFQFTDPPADVQDDDFRGFDGELPLLGPPLVF